MITQDNIHRINTLKTKILVTIGPASDDSRTIVKMIDMGATAFRLNTSHGSLASHGKTVKRIRLVESKRKVAFSNEVSGKNQIWYKYPIIVDLQGPKIRVGSSLPSPVQLSPASQKGCGFSEVFLKPGSHQEKDSENTIPVDYDGIADDVSTGSTIYLADGKMELQVTEILTDRIKARVIVGGLLEKRKGINIPGTTNSIDILTERDKSFVLFAIENDADYLALSFVRNARDIEELREFIHQHSPKSIPIIAKIEKPEALNNLREITCVADGIMIARGDLGIETPITELPVWQPKIIKIAQQCHKPVIVATQMLYSMIDQKIPKRSEVTDVATAAKEGADAVMLSEETASGMYPVLAVKTMAGVLKSVESLENEHLIMHHEIPAKETIYHPTDFIPGILNDSITHDLDGIVAISKSTGETILKAANTRKSPVLKKAPLVSISHNPDIARKIALYYATQPYEINFDMDNQYQTLMNLDQILRNHGIFSTDDKVIIFANSDADYDELRLVLWKMGSGALGNKSRQ